MLRGNPRRTIREFVQRVAQVFQVRRRGLLLISRRRDHPLRSGEQPGIGARSPCGRGSGGALVDEARGADASAGPAGRPSAGVDGAAGPAAFRPDPARAIVNLIAITIEKARALEDASHAEAARQSEMLKSALLDSLAHDIKTPLTSIKAAVTGLLGSSRGRSRPRVLLTIINEEADRLNQLAAEVIAMARVEAGKLHLEKPRRDGGRTDRGRGGGTRPALTQRPLDLRWSRRRCRWRMRSRIGAAGDQATARQRAQVFAGRFAADHFGRPKGERDRDRQWPTAAPASTRTSARASSTSSSAAAAIVSKPRAQAWDWPSRKASWKRTAERFGWRANRGKVRCSTFRCRCSTEEHAV